MIKTMNNSDHRSLVIGAGVALLMALGAMAATYLAIAVAPDWLAGWLASLTGPEPKGYWYLSRAAGVVSYVLIWLAVALGLMVTNKLARLWPGAPPTVDLHQFTGLLGLAFAVFHGLVLLGDRYVGYTLGQLLVPFASSGYRPLWVGLGQVGLYLAALVSLSFYVRKHIGYRTWRLLHYGSFLVYVLITLHGLAAGTDTRQPAILAMYIVTAAITVGLTLYRVRVSATQPRRAARQVLTSS